MAEWQVAGKPAREKSQSGRPPVEQRWWRLVWLSVAQVILAFGLSGAGDDWCVRPSGCAGISVFGACLAVGCSSGRQIFATGFGMSSRWPAGAAWALSWSRLCQPQSRAHRSRELEIGD